MEPEPAAPAPTVRVAAAGDLHCRESQRGEIEAAFAALEGEADLVLLAGDLTTHGEPAQAAILAGAAQALSVPVLTVLGNHDWHSGRAREVVAALTEGGVRVLDRELGDVSAVCTVGGAEVGVVGVKGFVGGFSGSHLPDFGEPSLRGIYREGSAEVEALAAGLRAVELCPLRLVVLHYAPVGDTIVGEPPGIWAFLGTDRLAAPIAEHEPDLVVHGHAHAGTFAGRIGEVPVHNVSIPVIRRAFWTFELTAAPRATTPIR
jgi:Icc-related predicted phosphoesterase